MFGRCVCECLAVDVFSRCLFSKKRDSSEKQPVFCPDVTRLCAPNQEVLKQLQGTIEEESGEASGSQLELIERLKGERATSETPHGIRLFAHSLT